MQRGLIGQRAGDDGLRVISSMCTAEPGSPPAVEDALDADLVMGRAAEVLTSAPAVARADRLPLQLPPVWGGMCWSWPARGLGFIGAGQVAAGQPGPVQARVQASGSARSVGTRLDSRQVSTSGPARRDGPQGRRGAVRARHKVAPWR